MKKGDLVCAFGCQSQGAGVILGFSIDFLIHRYDEPEYRVLWQKTGRISGNVQKKYLRKIIDA